MLIYLSWAPDAARAIWAAAAARIAVYGRKKCLVSSPDRFNQPSDAKDAHHSFEIVGKHVKAHFGAYPR